jgi:diacylglycerol kinase (ATP)
MSRFSTKSRLNSFRDAGRGLLTTLKTQHNAWIHIAAAVVVVTAGVMVGLSASDWKWLVMTIAMVWFAETINTAFEYLCDVVSPDYSEAVKHAKDIAAGAVLICAAAAVVMAALIFMPYF